MPNLPQSPDIGENLDRGISNSRISGQFLMKENCYNSRISDEIDMKLRPVTKLDKRTTATSKKFDGDFISENFDVIAIFPIYGQSYKTYIFINSNLSSYKNRKQD